MQACKAYSGAAFSARHGLMGKGGKYGSVSVMAVGVKQQILVVTRNRKCGFWRKHEAFPCLWHDTAGKSDKNGPEWYFIIAYDYHLR
ncbi:hypothetical protein HK14_02620 [Acetobacter cibinongensis]|uniref:Uncharacterized protein n=1 Tax=Acetobacter cibinongensis TaxID=146475 RepID=A0A1Z5YWC8_9PROT|nr:hypothetical protein HK14_02620 [Acetobacter cibinongensis]